MKVKDLDKNMIDRIIRALQRTWDYVASDCFVDNLGNDDPSITYKREEVFEIACDANFDCYHGDLEAYKAFRSLTDSYEEITKFFAPKAFPSETYGY